MSSRIYARRAAAVARMLRRAGARRGRPIVTRVQSSEALASLAYAAAALGSPFFPMDSRLSPATAQSLLAQVGESFFVDEKLDVQAILDAEAGAELCYRPGAGLALLIATSGSSGGPKAVMLSGENLAASAQASATVTPLRPGDKWLACLPLFHIGGFSILVRCAAAGADIRFHQGFAPEDIWRVLETDGVSHVSLTPTMLAQLAALGRRAPSRLRHALVGGAALSKETAARAAELGWPVQPTYGMSETCSQLATFPALPGDWRPGDIGPPLPGFEVALDRLGRLKARGPAVMIGYANPELEHGGGLEDGWFVTNDLVEISPDGELLVRGRADEVIVTGGKKVHPAEVENILLTCPGVRDCAVVGRPDPVWGAVVVAVYAGDLPEADLLAWRPARLSGAHRPRAAVRLDALPLLASGKPDRRLLREIAIGRES